jgi:membrane-bound serine protease (ClpP class)
MDTTQLFIILVLAGLLMMGAEIFVPGGILGIVGAMALMGAMAVGFAAFGPKNGMLAALAIVVFLGVSIVLWMQLVPRTRLGKNLTLSTDTAGYKSSTSSMRELVGKEGVALTPLGPAGLARIDGKRIDVVAEGKWIDTGARVRVVHVTGSHVAVREVAAPPAAESEAA